MRVKPHKLAPGFASATAGAGAAAAAPAGALDDTGDTGFWGNSPSTNDAAKSAAERSVATMARPRPGPQVNSKIELVDCSLRSAAGSEAARARAVVSVGHTDAEEAVVAKVDVQPRLVSADLHENVELYVSETHWAQASAGVYALLRNVHDVSVLALVPEPEVEPVPPVIDPVIDDESDPSAEEAAFMSFM